MDILLNFLLSQQLNNDPRSPELKIQAYAGPIKSKEEAEVN